MLTLNKLGLNGSYVVKYAPVSLSK